ncbi:MAG: hypothetical protein HN578_04400 [Rhodospirillales bacterium]|jgi:hypothetical protein|nr:hypothetical protein [Rhodospirillales bacterium]
MTEYLKYLYRSKFKVTFNLLLLALLSAPVEPANAMDWKKGKFGHLSQYIGIDTTYQILDDPYVKREVAAMLGPKVRDLKKYLQVTGPINFVSGMLVISGNKPHEGDKYFASVSVSPSTGRIFIVMQELENVSLYMNAPAWSSGHSYYSLNHNTKVFMNFNKIHDIIQTPPPNMKVYAPNVDGVTVEVEGYK